MKIAWLNHYLGQAINNFNCNKVAFFIHILAKWTWIATQAAVLFQLTIENMNRQLKYIRNQAHQLIDWLFYSNKRENKKNEAFKRLNRLHFCLPKANCCPYSTALTLEYDFIFQYRARKLQEQNNQKEEYTIYVS